ncbi:hypothetical protein ACQP2T_00375 [Nonomuraea sp. CA-143628]|uniref:hypothetical protein n=1 Tax=Nonomuraea sp. CA-143628 TaxID=3239997 RepID=UPI003D928E9E
MTERHGLPNAVGTRKANLSEFGQRRGGWFCAAARRLVGGFGVHGGVAVRGCSAWRSRENGPQTARAARDGGAGRTAARRAAA